MDIESEAGSGCGEEWNACAFHKHYVRSCDRTIQEMSIESEIMRSTDETGSRRCKQPPCEDTTSNQKEGSAGHNCRTVLINTACKATTTPAQEGENRQETPQQTQGTAESQNPPGPFILPDNAEVQITAESSPTADTSPRSKQVTSSDTRTQKPTPPHRDAEKQDTQESSQRLRLAPRGDRISTGSGIGSAEHSSLQQDFFTHPAHQLNLKYQSLS
ncbi:Hypothetical predicted protein [Pelobates cultripes]|uniref:Uncharacterized protein n=1 Tax=Pelobates cultripes TaxID=61616 RepID=A0AAD1SV35_PELCU|nr:Hypothetical predicted protein [Pelobates cultripes]